MSTRPPPPPVSQPSLFDDDPPGNAVVRVGIIGTKQSLTKAQKTFNRLTARIETRRTELTRWREFLDTFRSRIASDYEPLQRRMHDQRVALLQRFDQACESGALGKRERTRLGRVILDQVSTLLEDSDDPALIALHDKYGEVSHEDLRQEQAQAFKAMVEENGVPVSVQIAGREPGPMAETARIVEGMGAAIIDINMGCPARKVTGGLSGAALMREPDRALALVEAVVAAVPDLPVTLKMRLGWDEECLNAPDLARRARDAGVRMIVVHGRTRAQFYSGRADWAAIRAVRAAVPDLPLIANGDVLDAASARRAEALSGADAVMVGRGAQGAPWRLAQIAHELHGTPAPVVPQGAALAEAVAAHHDDILSHYGRDLGLRVARKHLGWYADAAGLPDLRAARAALMAAASPAAAAAAIRAVFSGAPGARQAA